MKKLLPLILVLSLVLIAGCTGYQSGDAVKDNTGDTSSATPAPGFEDVDETVVVDDGSAGDETPEAGVQEINVIAKQFEFTPNPIRVKVNQPVRLSLTSEDVDHGFFLPEFGVNEFVSPGQTTVVEFTPDKTGSFAFRCTVPCGIGHSTMTGTLIVEE